jgi:hypothetical protein
MLLVSLTGALQISWRPMSVLTCEAKTASAFTWLGLTQFLCKVATSAPNQTSGQRKEHVLCRTKADCHFGRWAHCPLMSLSRKPLKVRYGREFEAPAT